MSNPGTQLPKRQSLIYRSIITVGLVLFYYSFSISLTFYNRSIIKRFKFPLFLTVTHLIVKFTLASFVRNILVCWKKKARVIMDWPQYCQSMAPTGITSVADIGLSNWSLEFITISLYTMTKTSVIVFVLLFALCFGLEKFQYCQIFVVLFIGVGLFLFTYEATEFNTKGFLLVLSASFISGIRWALTQKVGQKKELGLGNPVDFMYHIQPWMLVVLIPAAFISEGPTIALSEDFFAFSDGALLFRNLSLVLGGALLAFGLEYSEFLLVSKTSSLTLSISGILKEMLMIFLAEEFNGDRMTSINLLGLVACLFGIAIHVTIKARAHTAEPKAGGDRQEMVQLVPSDVEEGSGYEDAEEELL